MRAVELGKDVLALMDGAIDITLPKFTLRLVLEELRGICDGGSPKRSSKARIALRLAERMKILEEPPLGPVDDVIIDVAGRCGFVVATNDVDLRRRLREISVPVVFIKDGYLRVEGVIID